MLANGASRIKVQGKDLAAFKGALRGLCEALAREIVADGEGVTRVFEIMVRGAASDDDAKRVLQRVFGAKLATGNGDRAVFLEDYDMGMAAHLVRGCDVWLNVPRPPLEASGRVRVGQLVA